jgi:hypothetical protein
MSDSIKKVVFISGMISDDKDYQEKFAEAEKTLTEQGYIVLNPAKAIPSEFIWSKAMMICFAMIREADGIVLLPDWEQSAGARSEKSHAEYHNKFVLYYEDLQRRL